MIYLSHGTGGVACINKLMKELRTCTGLSVNNITAVPTHPLEETVNNKLLRPVRTIRVPTSETRFHTTITSREAHSIVDAQRSQPVNERAKPTSNLESNSFIAMGPEGVLTVQRQDSPYIRREEVVRSPV